MDDPKEKPDKGKGKLYDDDPIKQGDSHSSGKEDEPTTVDAVSDQETEADDGSGTVLPCKRRREEEDETPMSTSSASDAAETTESSENLNISGNQAEQNVLGGPASRIATEDYFCFSKVLNRFEVVPHDPMLQIAIYDASELIDSLQIEDEFPPGTYRKDIVVYDESNRKYDMVLAHHLVTGRTLFSITGGWGDFVQLNRLSSGDEISFYKDVNADIVPDFFYYLITFKRRPSNRAGGKNILKKKAMRSCARGKNDPKQSMGPGGHGKNDPKSGIA